MRVWYALWLCCIQYFAAVWAAEDGPIDFDKTPTGGPSTLRACAQFAFNSDSRAGSVYSLGCQTISCVCRPDLIDQAHDDITNAVLANCGQDATVDVQQALKVYNDYCSANGYAIPGYTYVSTLTLSVSNGVSQATSEPSTTSGAFTTPANSGVTAVGPTATVTTTIVIKSSGIRVKPWAIFQILYLAPIIPIRYLYALADSITVTYTPSSPSPAVWSVATTFVTLPGAPSTSVETVYEGGSTSLAPTSPKVTTKTTDASTLAASTPAATTYSFSTVAGSNGNSSGSGTGRSGPTQLEVVGIIIGIIGGIVTTGATVWTCTRGARASAGAGQPTGQQGG